MGYKGFYEFKIALAKEMNNFVSSNTTLVSDQYIHAIEDMRQLEQSPVLRQAAKLLENADHIYSYGLMHSEFSARQFMFRMARNGYSVHSIDPVISLGDYSHLITNRDVVVIFSISGGLNHNSLVQECESVYSTGHPNIILFTMTDFTPMEKFADVTIKLPCVSRMTSEVIIDDAPIFYIGIELLLNVLTQK
jgi:DNA-binding MurR/RpiR family transcriptional regulator